MTCLHNIRYKKLYDNKVFPLGSTEKLLSSTQNDTFSNPRRYSFQLVKMLISASYFYSFFLYRYNVQNKKKINLKVKFNIKSLQKSTFMFIFAAKI